MIKHKTSRLSVFEIMVELYFLKNLIFFKNKKYYFNIFLNKKYF